MQSEQLNLKLMPELAEELDLVAQVLHVPKTDWARNILAHEVKRELAEHKNFIVVEFMNGNITKAQLVNALGKKDAATIVKVMSVSKKGFEDARKIAQLMR
ncbi:hypothetical protein HY642_06120 [Candidatus Woesearchaeota archaeon]|nr:hypothetical protein [Candidatus Woesearchaeota archaeon]